MTFLGLQKLFDCCFLWQFFNHEFHLTGKVHISSIHPSPKKNVTRNDQISIKLNSKKEPNLDNVKRSEEY